jgi:hypothetical protein
MTYTAHDVAGDGNCFFRALYRCMVKDDLLALQYDLGCSEDAGVARLRGVLAECIRNNPQVQAWYRDLVQLLDACPELVPDFPFFSTTLDAAADAIEENGTWASEFEFRVAEAVLRAAGVRLLVVQSPSMANLTEEMDVEESLYRKLQLEELKRCICLVHLANHHFLYFSFDSRRIMDVKDFERYLKFYLEED